MRPLHTLSTLSVLLLTSAFARAAPADVAGAELLFEEGRKLMEAGDYPNACPKLAESQRLAPAAGTLLNLGICYEKWGKTASAWGAFREAIAISSSTNQTGREQYARELAAALEPKLVRLTVEVAALPPVEVRRDGIVITSAQWGTPIPVDPGTHVIEATGPKKKPYRTEIDVSTAPGFVRVPLLDDVPVEVANGPSPPEGSKRLKIAGGVAVGAGAIALGLGAYFSVVASDNASELETQAGTRTFAWNREQADAYDAGKSAATIANVLLVTGAVIITAGAVMTVLGFRSGAPTRSSGGMQTRGATWVF